jgi:Plavaka transposase
MLYSDATLCDNLGKTQQHPVFLTLGNIPSWQRNKKDAKVLLGYMPILQSKNQTTRKSDYFRNLKRKITKRCWSIMLRPILKLEELELTINNIQITFAPRISVFLTDMLEANTITNTYKTANCKRPCPTCTVFGEDLNNMNLSEEDIIFRTPESMAAVIQHKRAKDYSIHDQKNVFWKFL